MFCKSTNDFVRPRINIICPLPALLVIWSARLIFPHVPTTRTDGRGTLPSLNQVVRRHNGAPTRAEPSQTNSGCPMSVLNANSPGLWPMGVLFLVLLALFPIGLW